MGDSNTGGIAMGKNMSITPHTRGLARALEEEGIMSDVTVNPTTGTTVIDREHSGERIDYDINRVSREVIGSGAHTRELIQTNFAAAITDIDKQAAALQVQAAQIAGANEVHLDEVGNGISVAAQNYANLASVQATSNANLASVQATTNFNALVLQAQTGAAAATLLATQNAAAAAAQLASCCCEMRSELAASTQKILDDGQKTRDLINVNTQQNLRDQLAARNTEIAALYAAGKAPSSPV